MNVSIFKIQFAEVNGTKKNRCVISAQNNLSDSKRAEQGKPPYSALRFLMSVFSNDFAAVDFREELC